MTCNFQGYQVIPERIWDFPTYSAPSILPDRLNKCPPYIQISLPRRKTQLPTSVTEELLTRGVLFPLLQWAPPPRTGTVIRVPSESDASKVTDPLKKS